MQRRIWGHSYLLTTVKETKIADNKLGCWKTCVVLERAYVDKPYAAKKKTDAWVTPAAMLNAKCVLFMTPNPYIMGANVKSKVENAIARYAGTYLTDIADKSGFDGDVDANTNYSDVLLWAKIIHEEFENVEKVWVISYWISPQSCF